jgi:molybdopterin-guanine dinucleotide biosynthesis protein A
VTVAGALLTGGRSRRMGVDKATLAVNGEALAVRIARVLTAVAAPVVEVGPGVSGLPSVREEPAGAGPLAAVLAAVDALDGPHSLLVVACDLPFVDEAVLRELAEHPAPGSVVPVVEGAEQYACARWSEAAIMRARRAFAAGDTGLRALLEAGDATFVPGDARALADVDTPDDLERLGLS